MGNGLRGSREGACMGFTVKKRYIITSLKATSKKKNKMVKLSFLLLS